MRSRKLVVRLIRTVLAATLACLASAGPAAQVAAPQAPVPAPDGLPPTPRLLIPDAKSGKWERLSENHIRHIDKVEQDLGGGTKVFADQMDVFFDEARLVASGNVVFAGTDGHVSAESAEFNVREGRGTFRNAFGVMSLGITADPTQFGGRDPDVYFWGDTIERVGPREYKITGGGFTTCVQPTPRWEVASSDVVLKINDYAIARNMVLRVKNVPVMYLPLIYYPIQDDERATGFLMPTYGRSTVRGQSISNGFFWEIGRSQDATFFHDWYTKTGQGFGSEYRYVTGPGSFGNARFFRLDQNETTYANDNGVTQVLPAETSYEVDVAMSQRLRNNLRAQASVDYFSSLVSRQLYYQNVNQATDRNRTISAALSGTFGRLSTGIYYLRSEVFSDADDRTEYGGTPRVTANLAPQALFGSRVYASVNSEYAYLPNRQYRDGELIVAADRTLSRFDVAPQLRAPLSQLTFLSVNTTAGFRSTYYSRSENARGVLVPEPVMRNYVAARSDIIGPVLTKIWDTPGSLTTERMKHVIEPTFAVDVVSEFNNQDAVPELTDTSDFVVGGAMRFTYGITNRLFSRARAIDGRRGNTREFMTIGVQQTYYTDPLASRYDTTYVTATGRPNLVDLSPIAVTARVSPGVGLDTNGRIEYDVSGNGLQSISVGGTLIRTNGWGTVNYSRIRYRAESAVSSNFVSGSANVTSRNRRVTGSYALSWDIGRGYVVSQSVIASYMAQCCGLTAEFQKYNFAQSSTVPVASDIRFNVGFVLAGLGTFSNFFGAFGGAQ